MSIEEIHNICSKYNIKNYTINDDGSINVDGNVNLYGRDLFELPLRFRNVTGWFNCSYNSLKSLYGAPISVKGDFYTSFNHLTSLDGAPSYVGGDFYCSRNPLKSLKGIPIGIKSEYLSLPGNYIYSDYLAYCRDLKFKKLLKCQ